MYICKQLYKLLIQEQLPMLLSTILKIKYIIIYPMVYHNYDVLSIYYEILLSIYNNIS